MGFADSHLGTPAKQQDYHRTMADRGRTISQFIRPVKLGRNRLMVSATVVVLATAVEQEPECGSLPEGRVD